MKRAALIAALGLLAALLLSAAPAHAAQPWSPPETVSSAAGQVTAVRVLVDANGFARATWHSVEPIPDHRNNYPSSAVVATREPGAAQFGAEQRDEWAIFPPVAYGRDRLLALSGRHLADSYETALLAKFGNTRGKLDFTQDIARKPYYLGEEDDVPPALAVHRDAVAAWFEMAPPRARVVRASFRRLGGRFREPVTLARRRDVTSVVAGSGPGVLFVAWDRGDRVEARVKRRGHGWSAVQRLGATNGEFPGTQFKVAFSGRRAYLAWATPGTGDYTLRAAVLPGGRTRFRPAQRIDLVEQELRLGARPISLVPLPGHGALLGWTGWDGLRSHAWVARTGRGARFGRKVSVAPPGESAVLGDLEVGGTRDAPQVLAVWTRLDDRGLGNRVRAAVRQRGGSFGPPEDVSDLDRAGLSVDAAFDPVGRRWTVLWPQTLEPVFDPYYVGSTSALLHAPGLRSLGQWTRRSCSPRRRSRRTG